MVEAQSAPEQPGAVASASTDGGAYVTGPINTGGGDFVGRDKHVYLRSQLEEVRDYLQGAVAAYVAAQQARILKPPASLDQPYKFLDSFELEDADNFFGRDAASVALQRTVMQDRLTVLHARSGAGKTSLLQAGLAPRLIREGRIPIFARAFDDPVLAVKRALAPASVGPWPALLSRLTLAELLGILCPLLPRRVQELVLIFDQFEEFFVFWSARSQRQPFTDDFSACYDDKDLPVRFVISLRKDYFSDLADFEPRIPAIFRSQFRLEAISRDEAAQAITAPVARLARPVTYTPELLAVLLDDLNRGGMELPHLQIICTQLHEQALQAGSQTIDLAVYDQLGRALGILGGYLNAVLARFPGSSASLARAILKELVSSETTSRVLAESALASRLEATRQNVDDTLARLVNARLVRRDEVDGEILYELAHDYLAAEIATWIGQEELAVRLARELLSRQVDNWHHNRLLIPVDALCVIHERRDQFKRLNPDELELLARSALSHGYEASYWFDRSYQVGVAADLIALEGLKSDNFRTRATAVTALSQLGGRFVDGIIPMLADDYPQVRIAAIAGLERLLPDGIWRKHLKYECYVPAGEFILGKSEESHRVYLDAFYVGKYPVTNAEFRRFKEDLGQPFGVVEGEPDHYSVVVVSWHDACSYAAWARMRPVTEAEWEKAMTGTYSLRGGTREVTLLHPGLSEWCSSLRKQYPYRADDGREDMASPTWRALRGSPIDSDDATRHISGVSLHHGKPEIRNEWTGFRVGWSPPTDGFWGTWRYTKRLDEE